MLIKDYFPVPQHSLADIAAAPLLRSADAFFTQAELHNEDELF
jgi:hypothetical protein